MTSLEEVALRRKRSTGSESSEPEQAAVSVQSSGAIQRTDDAVGFSMQVRRARAQACRIAELEGSSAISCHHN